MVSDFETGIQHTDDDAVARDAKVVHFRDPDQVILSEGRAIAQRKIIRSFEPKGFRLFNAGLDWVTHGTRDFAHCFYKGEARDLFGLVGCQEKAHGIKPVGHDNRIKTERLEGF